MNLRPFKIFLNDLQIALNTAMEGKGSTQFIALRRRLDKLGYQDYPLGLDSAPLAQQLLNDVYSTTMELRKTDEEIQQLKTDLELAKTQIEPLHAQNMHLMKENSQLHQKMITIQENTIRSENKSAASYHELSAENRRLKLLNQKSEENIKDLQRQLEVVNKQLREQVEHGRLREIDGNSRTRSSSRQSRKLARSRKTNGSVAASVDSSFSSSNNDIPAEVKQLNDKLSVANAEIQDKVKQIEVLTANINEYKDIVKLRDDEIVRLSEELQKETGRDGYLTSLKHKLQLSQIEVEKLRAQMKSSGRVGGNRGYIYRERKLTLTKPKVAFSVNGEGAGALDTSKMHSKISSNMSSSGYSNKILKVITSDLTLPKKGNVNQINVNDADLSALKSGVSQVLEEEDEDDIVIPQQKAPPVPTGYSEDSSAQSQQTPFQSPCPPSFHATIPLQNLGQASPVDLSVFNQDFEKLNTENRSLIAQVEQLRAQLAQKDNSLSQLTLDITYVSDSVTSICTEKDKLIRSLQAKVSSLELQVANALKSRKGAIDNMELKDKCETIQLQLDELQTRYDIDIEERDQKISQLENLVKQISTDPASNIVPHDCIQCQRLKRQLEEARTNCNALGSDERQELISLRSRAEQLELIIRSSEEQMHDTNDLNQKLVQAQHKLAQREHLYEELKTASLKLQSELDRVKTDLEEERKQSNQVPILKEKFRVITERMRIEHMATVEELKQKSQTLQNLSDKLLESQRLTRDFQQELQKARDTAGALRDEAMLHRTKSEEVQNVCAEKITSCQKEANAAVSHMRSQLAEKTHEAEMLKQILSDTRKQMAPLTETIIPELKNENAKLKRERSELAARVDRVMQLSQFTEKSTKFSPDSVQFIAAIHELQDQLQPYSTPI